MRSVQNGCLLNIVASCSTTALTAKADQRTSPNKPQHKLLMYLKSNFYWVLSMWADRLLLSPSHTGINRNVSGKTNNSNWRLLGSIQALTSFLLWWIARWDAVTRCVCVCVQTESASTVCWRGNKLHMSLFGCYRLYFLLWGRYEARGLRFPAPSFSVSLVYTPAQTMHHLTRSHAQTRLMAEIFDLCAD